MPKKTETSMEDGPDEPTQSGKTGKGGREGIRQANHKEGAEGEPGLKEDFPAKNYFLAGANGKKQKDKQQKKIRTKGNGRSWH